MSDKKSKAWIGGTVAVALVLMAASWFLAISPTLATASDTRAEAQGVRDQNDLLELQLIKLRSDFERLPEYRAELAAIRTQIPPDVELASYLRQLAEIAQANGVTVTAVAPSPPVPMVPAVPTAPVAPPAPVPAESGPAAEEPAEAAEGEVPVPAAPVPPAGPVAPEGFIAIPLSITVVGPYVNALEFIHDIQVETPRLLLVTGLQATGQEASEASGGRPATAVGDLELVITGFAYVLADPAVPAPSAPDSPEQPNDDHHLPTPDARNPLVPVGG